MKKCILSFAICIFVLSVLCGFAFADDTVYTEGALNFTIADQSITIVGYFGREEEVTIPAMIAGVPVNVIGKGAFIGTNAKIVNLPDTIMEVQEGAFDMGVSVVYNSNTNHPSAISGGTPVQEPANPVIPDDPDSGTEDPVIPTDITPSSDESSAKTTTSQDDYVVEEVEVYLDENMFLEEELEPELSPEPTPEATEAPEETEAPEVTAAPEAPAEQKSSSTVILIVAAVAVVAVVAVLLTKKKK